MPFEFIQIPAYGQGSAKEELNKLLRNGRIASVKKELVPVYEDSFGAFCVEFLYSQSDSGKITPRPKLDHQDVRCVNNFSVFSRLLERLKTLLRTMMTPSYSFYQPATPLFN